MGRSLTLPLCLLVLAGNNGVAFTPWVALPGEITPDVHHPLLPGTPPCHDEATNRTLAPIASLECIDESSATSDGSRTLPPSRQISLSAATGIRYKNLGKSGLKISSVGLGTSSCSALPTIPQDPDGLPPTPPLPPTTAADHLIPRAEIIQHHQFTIIGD
ncbi:hypothetical protein AVEN_157268-1 [Araneus ventricosus]|uniref:Uncharacterized protein n=1 Tax=Araneus ventricosus TaxID=182803 RepID=A0A4Y2MKY3_ARAVE|nr:hypothetical protein AVEN_157268-1 [Araneus ventricosus]